MSHILLYESDSERVSQLLFLLNLADIRCTVSRTIEEAYNWLSADRQKIVRFDLFLLGSLNGDDLVKKILAQISDFTTVPIVYIKQEAKPFPDYLSHEILICHPHSLLSCLHEHLSESSQLEL